MDKQSRKMKKAPTVAAVGALRKKQSERQFSAKSTATEAQLERLSNKLSSRPHHTIELRHCGIHHPAGRVQDLEARGFVIGVSRITVVDTEGFSHSGIALYELIRAPDGERA